MELNDKQRETVLTALYHTQKRYTVGDRFWEDYQELIDIVKKKNEKD